MKHEWRKIEKSIYLPKAKPEVIDVREFQYVSIHGSGNPNAESFAQFIQALYSMSYAIKMNLKKVDKLPKGYMDWTVYPLTGIWDITDKAKQNYSDTLNKDDLVFDLMIRQPDFVTEDFFSEMLALTKKKKPNEMLEKAELKKFHDGKCVQMLHVGSFDDEPASFAIMEKFADEQGLKRISKKHREIYLSDFRKVPEEKRKTALRLQGEG